MPEQKSARRRRGGWRSIPAAQWLTLTGLVLMVLKAAFELAKAVLALAG
jgi:hypothetical protein